MEKDVERDFLWLEGRVGRLYHQRAAAPAVGQPLDDGIGFVQAEFVNRARHDLIDEPGEGNLEAVDRGLNLRGLNVAGLRRDRPLEIVELDLGALFGERLHDSNPVLRVSDFLSDVKRFNFHGGDLITNQLRAARLRWATSA